MDADLLATALFIAIIIVAVLLGHWIHVTKFRYANEGSIGLMLGVLVAGLIYFYYTVISGEDDPVPFRLVQLNESLFFQVLLPPIIFYAGFSVKKKLFFQNFLTICLFGVLGTLASAAVIALGASLPLRNLLRSDGKRHLVRTCLALGAIFSCSDTVSTLQLLDKQSHPVLYSLVFGEGVINDAVSIVLLTTADKLAPGFAMGQLAQRFATLFAFSLLLGTGMGLLCSLLVRHLLVRKPSPDREVLVVLLSGLLTYAAAGALQLSAILAVFFCGLTINHYTWHSLTATGQMVCTHSLRILASLMETVLFVYSGLDMWYTALWKSELYTHGEALRQLWWLAGALLASIVVARVLVVLLGSLLANGLLRKRHKISRADGVVLWWSGLARGAISLALAYHYFYRSENPEPHDQIIIAAAIVVVLVSTLLLGVLTGPLLDWLMDGSCLCHGSGQTVVAAGAAAAGVLPVVDAAGRGSCGRQCAAAASEAGSSAALLKVPLLARPGPGEDFGPLLDAAVADVPLVSEHMVQSVPQEDKDRTERGWLSLLWRRFDHQLMQPVFGGRTRPKRMV